MKLSLQQLESHLTKNLAPLYLISGDEPLLVQDAMDRIRSAAHQARFSERVRVNTEGSEWVNELFSQTQSFSLFSEKRILEIDLTSIKLNASLSKSLQEIAQQLPNDTLLLIRIHKLDSKTEKTAWFQALEKKGTVVTIWPISTEQLPQWIIQRAKKNQLVITPAAASLLATLVEGNLLAAAQEIEKLSLLQLDHSIDTETIENAVSDHAHFDIFTLIDSVLVGNRSRSLRILDNLCAEETEPTLILWAFTRELRTLIDIMKQKKQGVQLSSLFSQFRIWEKRQTGVRAFLQRHTTEDCWNLLLKAAHIDRIIKGADAGNVWDAFQQLILRMA